MGFWCHNTRQKSTEFSLTCVVGLGTSENAVKTQIWIAISVYALVAIMKKQLKIEAPLYTILQVLSVSLFEKTELNQLFLFSDCKAEAASPFKQLRLFD